MRFFLQPIRYLAVFVAIFIFLATMAIVRFFIHERWRRLRVSNGILQYFTRLGLWLLKVKVNATGTVHIVQSGLYVGNHLSYLDILVVSSVVPAGFVTSVEVRETPFLGQIVQMAGCLFVERRNKQNIRAEISDISQALKQNLSVAVFPEATSTNGEQVLRFRRPLFYAAIDAQKPVMPFCVNYRRVGGKPINTHSRDKVCWYGDMSFAPHLWALAGSGGVEVDLHFLAPCALDVATEAATLAEKSQAAVESVFVPVGKNEGRPSKPALN